MHTHHETMTPAGHLTPVSITREALRVLHRKLSFVGTITREYDDSFARQGAKIGDAISVRLPEQYMGGGFGRAPTPVPPATVRAEAQRGVGLSFTAADLRLNLDEFSERFIEPSMSDLAGQIERHAAGLYRNVWNQINNVGGEATFSKVLQSRKVLVDNLAPLAGRTCSLNAIDTGALVDALKGLFNDQTAISHPHRDGFMGRTAGFDFFENGGWDRHECGDASGYVVAGVTIGGGSIRVRDGAGEPRLGDVFTVPGVNRVHPETKADTGQPQQFVVGARVSAEEWEIAPEIVVQGPGQIVTHEPRPGSAIIFAHGDAPSHGISMAYQRGAFAFATADMVMPRGVDFAAREVFDGISGRLLRQYDINPERFPCRLDLIFGAAAIRPRLACRMANQ